MNGATALPEVKIIRPPNISNINIIGKSHNFFLEFKNLNNSDKNESMVFYNIIK
tara:strand:- start:102 stop:263 length:162 start_codon:yes stop_codon:yes gene_type:complete